MAVSKVPVPKQIWLAPWMLGVKGVTPMLVEAVLLHNPDPVLTVTPKEVLVGTKREMDELVSPVLH